MDNESSIAKRWVKEPNTDPCTGKRIPSYSNEYSALQERFLKDEMNWARATIANNRTLFGNDPSQFSYRIFLFERTIGLAHDAEIYRGLLGQGSVEIEFHYDLYQAFDGFHSELPDYSVKTINIFLESLPRDAKTFASAAYNIFMINPEIRHVTTYYPLVDGFLCKTRYAMQIVSDICGSMNIRGIPVFTSHTSRDYYDPSIEKDYSQLIHIGGTSKNKQTDVVVDTWLQFPTLPKLTIVSRYVPHIKKLYDLDRLPKNIALIDYEISQSQLQTLMNQIGCHLCPSLAEGWGHYIDEARAIGALIISNDAPPMNELVTHTFGLLVKSTNCGRKFHQYRFRISTSDLANVVFESIQMPLENKIRSGQIARQEYLRNRNSFERKFSQRILSIVSAHGGLHRHAEDQN